MLRINKNATNSLPCTLNEKQTLTSPYFLVRFISEGQNVENSAICQDASSQTDRYNLLTVIESSTEDRITGQLTLVEGMHEYRVYEQTDSTNLNWALCDNTTPIEIGLVKVVGTQLDGFVTSSQTDSFIWR